VFCKEVFCGRSELQRFKNEEGRQEEGDKGQARMIFGEGGEEGEGGTDGRTDGGREGVHPRRCERVRADT
jgi:hypothetical protein